jgi:DNA repair exonuclease SbcCD nuclease subunit
MVLHFLHTADLQIGKGYNQFPPDVAGALRAARLETLKRIAHVAKDRDVDAVLVAGDCFDDIAVADETLRRFKLALEPFNRTWVLLPGNHDPAIAESPWTRLKRLSLPGNVIVADEPRPIDICGKAMVLPAPLIRRRDPTDPTEWFDGAETEPGLIRIGLAHGTIPEFLPAVSEAANPIAYDRADRARLDYLALGDWHGRLQVTKRTWYSGTPEPDRFRANDPGHVLAVTIAEQGAEPSIEPITVATYDWIQRTFEVRPGGANEIWKLRGLTESELTKLVVQLDLEGTVDLATHAAVNEAIEDLRARVMYLYTNDAGLMVAPTDDDLDAIDIAGFVRVAMNRLREISEGPEPGDARRALELLYGLNRQSN